MAMIVVLIGALSVLVGLFGIASPDSLKRLATHFRGPAGMYTAVFVRIAIGALLIWAGSACRPESPGVGWTVRVIGGITAAAGVVLLLLGYARYQALIDWSLRQPSSFLRSTSLITLVLGGFLIYAGI